MQMMGKCQWDRTKAWHHNEVCADCPITDLYLYIYILYHIIYIHIFIFYRYDHLSLGPAEVQLYMMIYNI